MPTIRFLSCLRPIDQQCIDHVAKSHGQDKKAEAVRFAIAKQAARSLMPGARSAYADLAAAVRELSDTGAPDRSAPPMIRWHQLYRESDLRALATIMRVHGINHKAEAIRLAIRAQARHDGFRGNLT